MKLFSIIAVAGLLFFGTESSHAQDAKAKKEKSPVHSLVRVNMTSQGYYFFQPWEKVKPSTRRGLGVVVDGMKLLTAAKFVANATYLEIEHPETGKKIPAKVEAVDYEANLAILNPLKPMFPDRVPLGLDVTAAPGDILQAWQVESNGTAFSLPLKISRAQVGSTFLEKNYFLQYEVVGVMQFRGGSVTVPMIRNGKLAGLLVSYDSKEQTSEVIAGPIIEHFMKDVKNGAYEGFPQFGIGFSQTLDDQFRKYLKLPAEGGGIYVSDVKEGRSAAQSGIKKGDVILSLDGHPIDARGYYTSKKFGKLSYLHLVQSQPYVDDTIAAEILREGKKLKIDVKLTRGDPSGELIDPYMFDRGPRYLVLGGLVFQELTRTYLQMYGSDWRNRSPFKLRFADAYPTKYEEEGLEKLVFLSRVIPTKNNVGYESLDHLIVAKVNGQKISSIKDLDAALKKATDGNHKIEFNEFPSVIYIDAKEAEQVNAELQTGYGIHELKRIE